jgi:hypothetical protein
MRKPFRLVPDDLSHDTVEALQTLLEDARKGDVIGVAFCAMYKQRNFIVNTAGEAHRNPVFTRGMIACLNDTLKC